MNFTASHNPPQYNGLKFSSAWGGPALPETTKEIEARANALLEKSCAAPLPLGEAREKGIAEEIDLRKAYLDDLKKKIDIETIRKSKLKVACDLLYGTGRDYLDTALRDAGCLVTAIHDYRDTMFGGHAPEPSEENLAELSALMKKGKFDIGLAVDGDCGPFRRPGYGRRLYQPQPGACAGARLSVPHTRMEGRGRALHRDVAPDRCGREEAWDRGLRDRRRVQIHRRPPGAGQDHIRRGRERRHDDQGPRPREGRHHRLHARGGDGRPRKKVHRGHAEDGSTRK